MQLAIGDVVRDLDDLALGAVVGFGDDASVGRLVVLQLSGGVLRSAWPHNVELVARAATTMTTGRSVATLAVLVVAFVAGVFGCTAEQGLGAGLLLTVLTGLGSAYVVLLVSQLAARMTGPQRFRI